MFNRDRVAREIIVVLLSIFVILSPILAEAKKSSKEDIKIGVIGPMKFTPGHHIWWGAELAAEEINAAGGIQIGNSHHDIKLVKTDDNSMLSVIDAVNSMERVITVDEVDFVVGGFRTEAVLAMMEVMADYRKIFLITSSSTPKQAELLATDFDRYKYWFRVTPVNSANISQALFRWVGIVAENVRKELGVERPKVALIMEKSLWVNPIVKGAKAVLPKMGMEVVGVWRVSQSASDVKSELTAIMAKGTHIIMDASGGPVGTTIAKQWGELRIPAALVGPNVAAQSKNHWKSTRGMCNYQMLYTTFGRIKVTDKSIPFYDKYLDRYGDFPLYGAGSYDALYILKAAIERAGSIKTDAVLKELEKTDYQGARGRICFHPRDHKWPHDVVFGPEHATECAVQWRDGAQVVVWPDGKPIGADKRWIGVRFEGTQDYELPPRMIKFWKGKK